MYRILNVPVVLLALVAQAIAEPPEQKFIRVTRDREKNPIALDTAIVRYEKGEGAEKVAVDLVGAVHVGDKSYYANLNNLFVQYDVVCYELVAPKDHKPNPPTGGYHPHELMGLILELDSQVKEIDYGARNFVHADMTPTEIGKKMSERGDNVITLLLSGIADMIRAQNLAAQKSGVSPVQTNITLTIDDIFDSLKVKRLMVGSFEGNIDKMLGPTAGKYLIDDRNEAAMKVVDTQIQLGKKKVALFYGAAHMPDFHTRLYEKGFKLTTVNWEKAWNLSGGRLSAEQKQIQQLLRLMKVLEKLQGMQPRQR